MMNPNNNDSVQLEQEYLELIKNDNDVKLPMIINTPQWSNPSDTFIKFSLYTDSSGSITSTDTLVSLPENYA